MNPKLLFCLALVLGACCAGYSRAENAGTNAIPGQIYRDETHGFQITVPGGWMAKKVAHEENHYGYAFLIINNQRRDLEFGDAWWGEFGWNFHGRETQLPPDEVNMVFGYSGGPLPTTMRADAVDRDLGSLLATNPMRLSSAEGVAYYGLSFFKRGQRWSIAASMKEPVTEQNREKVMSILQSFLFLDGPVGNAGWAEALAWNKLPSGEKASRELFGWPSVQGNGEAPELDATVGSRSVAVKKMGSAFSVRFVQGAYFVRNREYDVFADGKVVQRTYQRIYHWKFIGEWVGIAILMLALPACLLFMERTARIHE